MIFCLISVLLPLSLVTPTPHIVSKNTSIAIENLIQDLLYFLDFYSLNGHGPRRSYSSSPESATGQVLTLADLTPAGSEPNLSSKVRRSTPLISSSQPLRSSYTDLRNGSTHLSPRDQEVHLMLIIGHIYYFNMVCFRFPVCECICYWSKLNSG